MAITSGPHQSPQSQLPPLKYKTKNTFTWGAGGNTVTVSDPYIVGAAFVLLNVTGTVPQAGQWSIAYTPTSTSTSATGVQTVTSGSFTITSSDSETSTLTVEYIVI